MRKRRVRIDLDMVMFHLRGVVYFFGFRPRPGSIWFSPSRELNAQLKGMGQSIYQAVKTAFDAADKRKSSGSDG